MDIIRAKEIVQTLADGIDPTTGEVLADNSIYNTPEVIRALYTVLGALSEKKQESVWNKQQDPLRNVGKPWSDMEDEKLTDEFSSGMKISAIAREHGRTPGAIESRLDHLGLKKKPFWLFAKREKR